MLRSAICYCFVLYLVIKIAYGRENKTCCNQSLDSNFGTGVNLVYYKCNNETPATIDFPITEPLKLLGVLDKTKPVIFFIFGYLQTTANSPIIQLMQALCYGRTDNVVLVDWSKYSYNINYVTVFKNAQKIGILLAQSIRRLVDNGLNVKNIYPIGFSLGAHIAGFITKCNNFTLPRITGLDPANPFFTFFFSFLLPSECYLEPSDAVWVDIIHTDMYGFGAPAGMGTAEFYANKGTAFQPGCPFRDISTNISFNIVQTFLSLVFCNHRTALQVYAISKCKPEVFTAVECDSYNNYKNCMSKGNQTNVGYTASDVHGHFFFSTKNITITEKYISKICKQYL